MVKGVWGVAAKWGRWRDELLWPPVQACFDSIPIWLQQKFGSCENGEFLDWLDDFETGLYYYRARYYDPALGRFISQDPMAFAAADANLYRYVRNNPTNRTDPTGLLELAFQALSAKQITLAVIGALLVPGTLVLGLAVSKQVALNYRIGQYDFILETISSAVSAIGRAQEVAYLSIAVTIAVAVDPVQEAYETIARVATATAVAVASLNDQCHCVCKTGPGGEEEYIGLKNRLVCISYPGCRCLNLSGPTTPFGPDTVPGP